MEWTSKRLKKFADWATGLNIPYCPVVYSRDQVCSYYYYAIGGEKLEIIKEDDEEYIPQYAIFLGIAVNTQKYFTIEELTWATGCGNTEKLSWRTIDKNTGKELTIKDIIKQKHLGLFYERMLAHLCNREGLFSSFYSEDFTDKDLANIDSRLCVHTFVSDDMNQYLKIFTESNYVIYSNKNAHKVFKIVGVPFVSIEPKED